MNYMSNISIDIEKWWCGSRRCLECNRSFEVKACLCVSMHFVYCVATLFRENCWKRWAYQLLFPWVNKLRVLWFSLCSQSIESFLYNVVVTVRVRCQVVNQESWCDDYVPCWHDQTLIAFSLFYANGLVLSKSKK